ncbi:MAG: hypothetical protein KDA31_10530 [Phycisphaerales bacterium]|nr:hypothetical protein [Phycisphaerales bacterium]MCB9836617.1 hypothetical protein [Phycisphaera sp.]
MNNKAPSRFSRTIVTIVGLLATVLIVIALNVLGHRFAWRADVTSTGSLRPSPRSMAVLESLTGQSEIILAASISAPTRDRTSMARVLDMLDELERASLNLRTTVVDTATSAGQEQFEALIARLAEERAEETGQAVDATRSALTALNELASQMKEWAAGIQSLSEMREPDPGGVNPWITPMTQQASYLRVTSGQVAEVSTRVEQLLGQQLGEIAVPDVSQSRRLITETHAALGQLIRNAVGDLNQRAQDEKLSQDGRAQIQSLIRSMSAAWDSSALSIDAATTGPLPVLSRVAQALASGEAAIVIGPSGELGAITIDQLVPNPTPGSARVDAGRHAETLLVSALSTTMSPGPRTTAVLVHASDMPLLETPALTQLIRSTETLGVRWLEWPIALSPEMPVEVALAAKEPGTVFIVTGLSTTAAGGPERAIRTGSVLQSLLDNGHAVMVNLAPSTLPGVGEADPIAEPLKAFGLAADTGKPVLSENNVGNQRFVEWEQLLVPSETGSALAEVISGRPVRLTWPIVIDRIEEAGEAWPLVRLDQPSAWRESEWVGYWMTRDTDRPGIGNAPAPGGSRDADLGEGVVAWATKRAVGEREQRVIVVGSHLWLFDMVARRKSEIEGRLVETSPGNTELAQSAIEWLAGHDDMIARSGDAAALAIVQPMDPTRRRAIQWVFIGGLPVLVLILGGFVRLVRG